MRSLFLKIFLGFWLTVILVGIALVLSVVYSSRQERLQLRFAAGDLLPAAARTAAEEFERAGAAALAGYVSKVEKEYPVFVFFFDQDGREIFDNPNTPAKIRTTATKALDDPDLILGENIAAQRATGPSGRSYSLVLAFNDLRPMPTKAGAVKIAALLFPLLTLIAGGVFCYLITRNITSPLFRLGAAAASMAQGNLDTRVGPSLGSRRDEIAKLGRDFDHMAERIESLVAGHKQLLGDVSHELRSPLARLIVALGLAKQESKREAAEHLDRIAVEAHRLDNLIGQLLTLSRINTGFSGDVATTFDLVNLVHEVANDADFEARAQGRSVVVIAADPCDVTGSEELLRSAIENIVRNAVRFTRTGTAVEITLQRTGNKIMLRVRDHGFGVPAAMLSEIFLPFRRVATPEMPGDGAGLGLAIAQRAIGLHGGTIHTTNASDGGLIVEVELESTGDRVMR